MQIVPVALAAYRRVRPVLVLQDAEDLAKLTAQLTEARKKNDELKQLAVKKAAQLKQKLDKVKVRFEAAWTRSR